MFTKIDKKILLILIIIVLVILAGVVIGYKYFSSLPSAKVSGNANTTPELTSPQIQVQTSGGSVQTVGGSGPGISVCQDKCGDGICETSDPKCGSQDLNCICPESHTECPQDCK